MSTPVLSSLQEIKLKWTTLLATFLGMSFLTVMSSGLSMFMDPIAEEFHWSKTFVSFGYTCSTVVLVLLSPIVGGLVDRYGSRRVALPGIIATSLVMASFAQVSGSSVQWIALWVTYALIALSVKPTIWTATVVNNFRDNLSLAIGITLCGTAAAAAIVPPLANWLIANFGWRVAYAALALGWGAVTFIIAWAFLHDSQDTLVNSMTSHASNSKPAVVNDGRVGLTMAQAWRNRALWQIALSTLIIMTATIGLTVHQISILGAAGIARSEAAWLASLAGIASIGGKLGTGYLLDRLKSNWISGVSLGVTTLAFGLLIDGIHTPSIIIIAMLANGYSQGAKLQICTTLTVRHAGTVNYGKIYGFMSSVQAFGAGAGPLVAGLIFDASGGYTAFLVAGTVGSIVASLLLITLPRPITPS